MTPPAGKVVAVNQSNYVPWKGYFDLIHDADLFVFYDDVQFTKNDWRNRNKLKDPSGTTWITIPVGADIRRRICDVAPSNAIWQTKHWKTLSQLYGRAPHFGRYREWLEHVYRGRVWASLSELNQYLIEHISRDFLGMKTKFLNSTSLSGEGRGQERLLNMLRDAGATRYVSGPAGKAYIEPGAFDARGIDLVWKDYSGYPEYAQFFPPFRHDVSILDLLFHTGPDAPHYIWGWRERMR